MPQTSLWSLLPQKPICQATLLPKRAVPQNFSIAWSENLLAAVWARLPVWLHTPSCRRAKRDKADCRCQRYKLPLHPCERVRLDAQRFADAVQKAVGDLFPAIHLVHRPVIAPVQPKEGVLSD